MVIALTAIKLIDNMKIKITLEIDSSFAFKFDDINNMSIDLENYFRNKDYGTDVKEIFIGLICIETSSDVNHLFKVRKPKYIDFKKIVSRLTGQEIVIQKNFSYDLKLDYRTLDDFKQSNQKDGLKILALELINSLENLNFLSKKVKSFERIKFENDFKAFFKANSII